MEDLCKYEGDYTRTRYHTARFSAACMDPGHIMDIEVTTNEEQGFSYCEFSWVEVTCKQSLWKRIKNAIKVLFGQEVFMGEFCPLNRDIEYIIDMLNEVNSDYRGWFNE